jgi:uncharacterized protein (TIGR02001 family)
MIRVLFVLPLLLLLIARPSHADVSQTKAKAPAKAQPKPKPQDDDDDDDESDSADKDDDQPDPNVIGANVALASDYLVRGISQTAGEPALQGGFDWEHPFGLYLGLWGSNVHTPTRSPTALLAQSSGGPVPTASLEVDYYAGFSFKITDDWKATFGFLYYSYWGTSQSGFNGYELPIRVDWKSVYTEIATDAGEDGNTSQYASIGFDPKVLGETTVDVGTGITWFNGGTHYEDFHLSVAHDFLDVEWKLLIAGISDSSLATTTGNPHVVASVTKAF